MAKKTVQPIDIALSIKGAEKVPQLKGLFRDLGKTVKVTDNDIASIREGINEYVKTANQSEAVIKGQIKAFEGLREQAKRGGKVYSGLSDDIAELKAELDGSSTAIEAQRKSILELASGAEVTAKQLKAAADQLFELRKETKLDSVAFNALGKDIDALATRVSALGEKTKQTAKENRAAVASVNATLAKYEASAQAQMAGAARREQIVRDEVLALSEKKKVTDELIKKENQLTAAIARGRQLSVQEGAREARRRIRAGAQVYTGRVELGDVDAFDQRLGELPQTTSAFSQRLSELQDRLANTTRGGDQYVQVALRIAQVQREASAATQGLGAALVKDLASGVAVRNQKNLREVIGQLQSEMAELNTETAEGSAKYAENARQVNSLQKELDGIANSYRNVTDMARQATAAQGQYANTAAARNYLRRGIARAQEAATAEMARAITQGAAQTPLLLPAAGQTTAPGTGALRSGGAREFIPLTARLGGGGVGAPARPQPGDVQAISARRYMGPAGTPEQIDAARRKYIAQTEAVRQNAEAKAAAARVEQSYRAEIDKATKANNGSINSSNRLKSALEAYRSTLPTTSREFAKLTKRIDELDRKSEAVSRRMGRRRMSPMQITQAAGAAISGGIFGGPEGFIGGVAGGLFGGVGGAFAGAAIGAQVGAARQSLGEVAKTVAEVNSMKIALAGVSESAEDYQKSFADVIDISKKFVFPVNRAIGEFTKLKAAVVGAGFGTQETTDVFKGFAAAILATGGNAETLSGALLAASQVFSKGKVQAEELRGQIGERLPGAFTTFAQSIGVSSKELDEMLRKGEVSTENFVEFTRTLFARYEKTADILGSAPERAGQRLELALSLATLKFGGFFQKVGAGFQDYLTGLVNLAIENEKELKLMAAKFLAFGTEIGTTIKRAVTSMIETFKPFFDFVGRGLSAISSRFQTAQREIAVRRQGADPMKIYEGVLSGYKEQHGIGKRAPLGPGRSEEVRRRYNEALGSFLGEESYSDLVKGYREMMDEFQPGSGLFGTSLGDGERLTGVPDGQDKKSKDISKLEADAKIATINLRKEDILGLAQRIKLEADLARKVAETLEPQKQRVRLAEINRREARQMLALQEKITNAGFKMGEDSAKRRTQAQEINDELEKSLQARKLELGLITQEEFNQLEIARERARLQELQAGGFISAEGVEEQMNVFKELINQTPIDKFVKQAQASLNDLQTTAVNVAQGIGNAISSVLTNGVNSLIEGTKNAKEVFADFLKSIGRILMEEGAKQIATYVAIGVAKAFAGMAGGGGPDPNSANVGSVLEGGGFTTGNLADAAASTPLRANGGPVNAGRPYMVGERGPELFVPGSNGGIMRNEEMRQLMGRSPAGAGGGAASMNFTFETTNIGGTEYVSREQLEAAMATTRRQAANDGAKRGMSMTLDKMQNSPRTRSRIGIG